MKQIIYFLFLGLLTFCFQSCNEDEDLQPGNEKVQFTFKASSADPGGRIKAINLPEGSSLLISVNNSAGAAVLTNHRINLLNIGDGYITEPLELNPGRYVLTDFMVVNGSEVLYVTPKKGSPLAAAVSKPLPYNFTVSKNKVSNIEMEVVDAEGHEPEAFGYVSFNLNVVHPFQISVFEIKDGKVSLTEAKASIYDGENLIGEYSLSAKINTISFKGDPDKTYTLNVVKAGYSKHTQAFKLNDLSNEPLKVILKAETTTVSAIDLLVQSYDDSGDEENSFRIRLEGSGQVSIKIDDMPADTQTLPIDSRYYLDYGLHNIRIQGNLGTITEFYTFGYNHRTLEISGLELLPQLKQFTSTLELNERLDLSHNENLELVDLWSAVLPAGILLPEEHYINELYLNFYDESLSSSEVDELITNIYNNAVNRNIQNGFLSIDNRTKPSADINAMLNELQNDYNWEIDIFR